MSFAGTATSASRDSAETVAAASPEVASRSVEGGRTELRSEPAEDAGGDSLLTVIVALVALSIVYICLMFLGRTSLPTVPEADNGGTVLAETERFLEWEKQRDRVVVV